MKEWTKNHIEAKAWGIFALANAFAIWGWSTLGADFSNIYRLFPLFGLIAISTMWGHYMVWALREWSGADAEATKTYTKFTQWIVLGAILLHPSLIIYQLNADGLGLPPGSYRGYAGDPLFWFIILGTMCLFVFLAYEFKKYLQKYARVWQTIRIANHVAMLGIVVHALKLGSVVRQVPMKFVLPIYGLSLVAVYAYLAYKKKLL